MSDLFRAISKPDATGSLSFSNGTHPFMTKWVFGFKAGLVIGPPVLLLAAIYIGLVAPLLSLKQDLADESETARALLTRYMTLVASRSDFSAQSPEKSTFETAIDIHKAPNANAAAAQLQQKLTELVALSNGQLRQARIEIRAKRGSFIPFVVNITFAASTMATTRILYAVETLQPKVFVDALSIRSGPSLLRLQNEADPQAATPSPNEPVLDTTLTVLGFIQA